MKKFIPFNIPLTGLKEGIHQFDFHINKLFFDGYEESLISDGKIDVIVKLDKQATVCSFEFTINGIVIAECDRCLEQYEQEIASQERLLIKYSEQPREEVEVIYILPGTDSFNIAHYIYEFICLALPMKKVHPDIDGEPTCDPKIMDYLDYGSEELETENPIWSELKKLKKN